MADAACLRACFFPSMQLAECPDRADWKACTSSSEDEQKAAEDFRQWFKPYDVMAAQEE